MTCAEFEEVLPEIIEGDRTAEQETHLRNCFACQGLVSDLEFISHQAKLLQSCDEPSPRVWNTLEVALRQQGLIRPAEGQPTAGSFTLLRKPGWLMVPALAMALIAFGIMRYQGGVKTQPNAGSSPETAMSADLHRGDGPIASTDQQLLEVLSVNAPSRRAAYEAYLRKVNAYVQDAESSAHSDPNDEEAQQYLMAAYEQKAMVYEMALDRSLP